MISVVTPWRTLLSALGLIGRVKSEWVLMSMKPGATARPPASITLVASVSSSAPMAAMRPSRMARSPGLPAAPVPSSSRPPRIRMSKGIGSLAPVPQRCPQAAVEPEAVAWRRRGERADAIEPDAGPLETAFLQHPARRRIAHPRPRQQRVVAEIAEGMVDQGAGGLGGVALAPERNAEPIPDLGGLAVELGGPAAADDA